MATFLLNHPMIFSLPVARLDFYNSGHKKGASPLGIASIARTSWANRGTLRYRDFPSTQTCSSNLYVGLWPPLSADLSFRLLLGTSQNPNSIAPLESGAPQGCKCTCWGIGFMGNPQDTMTLDLLSARIWTKSVPSLKTTHLLTACFY